MAEEGHASDGAIDGEMSLMVRARLAQDKT